MKAILFTGGLLFLLSGSGCSKSSDPNNDLPSISPQLIKLYDDPQGLVAEASEQQGFDKLHGFYPTGKTMLDVRSTTFTDNAIMQTCIINKSTQPERFDSLVRAHGDTHWNNWSTFGPPCMFRVTTGLHVTCDRDYDTNHLAGTLLDDLLTIHYMSADGILVDGEYILPSPAEEELKPNYQMGECDAKLNEFNNMRLKLVSLRFTLLFIKNPSATSDYVFTCTYTNEDGKKLTASTDPLRIQGER